jgi:hypothetical protein
MRSYKQNNELGGGNSVKFFACSVPLLLSGHRAGGWYQELDFARWSNLDIWESLGFMLLTLT